MYEITRKVDKIITSAANRVVTKGGSFDHARAEAVRKVHVLYPELNTEVLLGGFDHRYVQALLKKAA